MATRYQNVGRHGFQLSPNKSICAKNVPLRKSKSDKIFSNPLINSEKTNSQKHVAQIFHTNLRLAFLFWSSFYGFVSNPLETQTLLKIRDVSWLWVNDIFCSDVVNLALFQKNWDFLDFFGQGDF